MTGWPLAWKCFVACLFLDESQQPTCPHVRQSRRCTQRSPVARHSSQPSELGVTGRICSTWGQVCWVMAVLLPPFGISPVLPPTSHPEPAISRVRPPPLPPPARSPSLSPPPPPTPYPPH